MYFKGYWFHACNIVIMAFEEKENKQYPVFKQPPLKSLRIQRSFSNASHLKNNRASVRPTFSCGQVKLSITAERSIYAS